MTNQLRAGYTAMIAHKQNSVYQKCFTLKSSNGRNYYLLPVRGLTHNQSILDLFSYGDLRSTLARCRSDTHIRRT